MRRLEGLSTVVALFSRPLVLIGVVLLCLFGLYYILIDAGIFQPLTRDDSASLLGSLLNYGFWIALAVVVLGFGLQFYTEAGERSGPPQSMDNQYARNLEAMLAKMRHIIEDALSQTLLQVARIELGLQEEPKAIERPWEVIFQQVDRTPRALPPSSRIGEVFDELGQGLLILGAPGAGKTTLLWELALDLMERAERDLDRRHPIPVVLNLSSWFSWAQEQQALQEKVQKSWWKMQKGTASTAAQIPPLDEWLVEELSKTYVVPPKVSRTWVEREQVLPLLDGLDEVVLEYREACVKSINAWYQQHGHVLPMAVCCRALDYKVMKTRLCLAGAVRLPPLNRDQIEHFLSRAGEPLHEVHILLQKDATLWELLDTPLILDIMRLALREPGEATSLLATGSLEERRTKLFTAYIDKMFTRRKASRYTPTQIRHWLTWLAQSLIRRSQNVFHLEWLGPNWLPRRNRRVPQLLVGLVLGLASGAFFCLVFGWTLLPGVALAGTAIVGAGLLVPDEGSQSVQILRWSWRAGGRGMLWGLGFWLILTALLVLLLLIGRLSEAVKRIEWSDHEPLAELILGVQAVLTVDLGRELLFSLLVISAIVAPVISLFFGLLEGFVEAGIATQITRNQGLRHLLRSALVALVSSSVGVPIVLSIFSLPLLWVFQTLGVSLSQVFGEPWVWTWTEIGAFLLNGLFFGIFVGLLLGAAAGGFAYLRDYAIHLVLWQSGSAPLDYFRFLECAADLVFLRKQGSGYIFVHRLLMEHFAELEPPPPDVRLRLKRGRERGGTREQLDAVEVHGLFGDYLLSGATSEALKIRGALHLSDNIFAADNSQLAGQLLGRLATKDGPTVAALLDRARAWRGRPWLRPLKPTLTPPGGPLLHILADHSAPVVAIALTLDGRRVVTASEDCTLKVWDVKRGRIARTLTGHSGPITGVSVTLDGRRAVSASKDRTVKVWDLAAGRILRTFANTGSEKVAITADGRRVVSASYGTLIVGDVDSGQLLRTTKHRRPMVEAISFMPDARHLVLATWGRSLKTFLELWEIQRHRLSCKRRLYLGEARKVAISLDGRRAVSADF